MNEDARLEKWELTETPYSSLGNWVNVGDNIYPDWVDVNKSYFTKTKDVDNYSFLRYAGILIIDSFDRNLPLGLYSFVKGHSLYGNRFGIGWYKDSKWVRGDQLMDVDFKHPFDYAIDNKNYLIYIDASAIPDSDTIYVSDGGDEDIRIKLNQRYGNIIPESINKTLMAEVKTAIQTADANAKKLINCYPEWFDYQNSIDITDTINIFLNNAGNLIIKGFDKSLKLGIFSFVKGSVTYGNQIGFAWLKGGKWVRGAIIKIFDFESFEYVIDGIEYNISIDVKPVPDQDKPYVSDGGTDEVKLKLTDRYDTQTDVEALQTDVEALQTDVEALQTDVEALQTDWRFTYFEKS